MAAPAPPARFRLKLTPAPRAARVPWALPRGDAPVTTILSILAGEHSVGRGVLGFLSMRDSNKLRALCTEFRDAVMAFAWKDDCMEFFRRGGAGATFRARDDWLAQWREAFPMCERLMDPEFTYENVAAMNPALYVELFEEFQIGEIALHYVPAELRSFDVCDAAMRKTGHNARWLPAAVCTPDNLCDWVAEDGWAYGYLDHKYRTPELAVLAVKSDAYIIDEEWVWEGGDEACFVAARESLPATSKFKKPKT